VVTDIHGWIAGLHARHEPNLNVDFGDLVSLYQKLSTASTCNDNDDNDDDDDDDSGDWFLVFNGDFMDGTGLSAKNPTDEMTTILKQMPFDYITTK
jgi:2',3'-cyclic-nucleotide 2'-phosphodiesterase (5'-nucleotidase family)